MNEPSDSKNIRKAQRDKIVGLGERSICKSYFPQLRQQIEELEKSKKALQQSEEKYRQLVENINEAIFTTDLHGIVTFVSPKIKTILGFEPEQIIGKSFIHYVHSDDHELINDRFQNLISGGGGSNEYRFVDTSGGIVWIRTSSRPVYQGKQIIGTMGTIMDITEKKQLSAELQQSRKMEAIGTLSGGIAHDFNNILAAIIGYTELSLGIVSEDNELKQYLNEILNAGTRARDLIRQILAFSRQRESELSDVLLGPVIKETLKFLRSTLPSSIEIRQHIAAGNVWIQANPIQVQQILMNLCTNAVQAMVQNGGVLEVRLDMVAQENRIPPQMQQSEPGQYAKLTISDTGHGIPEQLLTSIFDPYFTTKKIGEGTGLGLSVVYGIVKSLGGEIRVKSKAGAGSSFEVYLPAFKRESFDRISSLPEDIPKGDETILIVDDEEMVARTNQLQLERIGYTVVTKTDSREALDLFYKNPDKFDLVITDLTMPKITGDTLAAQIMKIRPNIPVILCTGYSSVITEDAAATIGIKKLMMKPFKLEELAKNIRSILDKSPAD